MTRILYCISLITDGIGISSTGSYPTRSKNQVQQPFRRESCSGKSSPIPIQVLYPLVLGSVTLIGRSYNEPNRQKCRAAGVLFPHQEPLSYLIFTVPSTFRSLLLTLLRFIRRSLNMTPLDTPKIIHVVLQYSKR